MTNCVNCGAPITGHKCQYCGTEYNGNGVAANFSESDYTGVLTIGGKEYQVYLGCMEANLLCGANTGRDMHGRLHRGEIKHKFTLIEL